MTPATEKQTNGRTDEKERQLKFGILSSGHVLCSAAAPVQLPDVYFSELVWKSLQERRTSGRPVLVNGETGAEMTADDVLRTGVGVGHFLLSRGVREGDVVFGFSSNNESYACFVLAVPAIGAILSGCLSSFPLPALVKQMQSLSPVVLLCCQNSLRTAAQAADQVASVRFVIVTDADRDALPERTPAEQKAVYTMTHVMSQPPLPAQLPVVPLRKSPAEAICYMHTSSGSTGRPKTVARSHAAYVTHMLGMEDGTAFEYRRAGQDVVSGRLLIPHTTGPMIIMKAMHSGCTLIILSDLLAHKFVSLIRRYAISHIVAVPTLVAALAQCPLSPHDDVSSLTSCAVFGSVLSSATRQQFRDKFPNCTLFSQMYGTTESGQISYVDERVMRSLDEEGGAGIGEKGQTVGRLVRGVRVRVMDRSTGQPLPARQVGELEVHGPCQTDGYYCDADADADNYDRSRFWFRSGDAAFFDEDGLLFIVDRFKMIMKVDGIQVSPAELESVLMQHEHVSAAAVVGIHDPVHGEVPVAFVVLDPSPGSDARHVLSFHNEQVAPHKWIRELRVVQALPLVSVGKVDKGKLLTLPADLVMRTIRIAEVGANGHVA